MDLRSFTELRGAQSNRTLTNTTLVPLEVDGHTFIATLDELAALMTGQTVVPGRQGSHRSARAIGPVTFNADRVEWGGVSFDTDTMWSGLNPSRLSPPNDATMICITACLVDSIGGDGGITLSIGKNNEGTPTLATGKGAITTGPIQHTAGDYYEVYAGAVTPDNTRCFFTVEILEQTP